MGVQSYSANRPLIRPTTLSRRERIAAYSGTSERDGGATCIMVTRPRLCG